MNTESEYDALYGRVEMSRMGLGYISKTYDVPARKGARVKYSGSGVPEYGTVVGATAGHIRVKMDGDTRGRPYHPTWCIEYVDEEGQNGH